MSRAAWQKIVDGYEQYDPSRMYGDYVCLHDVSKIMRGRSEVAQEDTQKCPNCSTLKREARYEMEIESGPCDSEQSKSMLNGMAEGVMVAAYRDGDMTNRGGISGNFKWAGSGATVVGRTFAVLNAGTHHAPVDKCEECHFPGHAEGWLRGAIIDGECKGCRVNGAITYSFKAGEGGAEFTAVFEGLLICQCHAD